MDRAGLIRNSRRVVVKVGSGVLTTEQGLDIRRMEHLADEIAALRKGGRQVVLVSSGSIAGGKAKAGLGHPPRTLPEKQACAALGQAGLMQVYEEAFQDHGMTVAQLLLTADDLVNRKRYENARNTLFTLLDWGVLPIVNENDTVSVAEIKLGDNDNLAAMLTNLLGAELMIILTNVDGLLDADPRENPDAKRVPLVRQVSPELLQAASNQPGTVGAGGIFSKVRSADKAARCGAHTIVANGGVDGILTRLAQGEDLGTLFMARSHKLTSRKHWIAFTAMTGGALVVDEGAVRPLLEQGKSLLAAGVLRVKGSFKPGDAVQVLGPGDCILGVGLINYSSKDTDDIKGLHSGQIQEKLGHKEAAEVIHRDNLVVFDLDEEESVACLLN